MLNLLNEGSLPFTLSLSKGRCVEHLASTSSARTELGYERVSTVWGSDRGFLLQEGAVHFVGQQVGQALVQLDALRVTR